jgi:hypothetical protein
MWRKILAFVLFPSLAAAQNPGIEVPAAPQPEAPQATTVNPGPDQRRPTGPTFEKYTFYDAIRRGRKEEALIRLSPQGFVTSPRSPVQGIVPLRLELQPADGITVSAFRYPKTQPRKVKFQAEPIPVSGGPEIFFKIRADESAELGVHTLQGKLSFQVIDYNGSGVGPVQQMDVQIPITVVEHNAKVTKKWPIHHMPVALMVVFIVVIIPVAVAALPFYLICLAATKGNCAD